MIKRGEGWGVLQFWHVARLHMLRQMLRDDSQGLDIDIAQIIDFLSLCLFNEEKLNRYLVLLSYIALT